MTGDLLEDQLPEPTLADQIKEVERELEMRARVYPRMVKQGKMSAFAMADRMTNMMAVLATLKALEEQS